MKRQISLAVLLVAIMMVSGCLDPVGKTPSEKFFSCSADSDCKVVDSWICCGCYTAINKNHENGYNGFMAKIKGCEDLRCEPCPSIEEMEAVCGNGKCGIRVAG